MPSFSEAFAKARKEGKKVFEWNGKSYSTQLKGEGNNRGGIATVSLSSAPETTRW